jgi:uncharacterized protein
VPKFGLYRLSLLLCLLLPQIGWGQQPIPVLRSPVTDLTGTLSEAEKVTLETQLIQFSREKGSQVSVLIVPSTQPETIEQYGIRAAEAWKLGRKGVDDGALLLVAKDDHTLRIEVGYGLEGALNDAVSKRIIEEIIIPRFKEGNFSAGISDGVGAIIKVILGENLPAAKAAANSGSGGGIIPLLIVGVIIGLVFRALLGKGLGSGAAGVATLLIGIVFLPFIVALILSVVTAVLVMGGAAQRGFSSGSGRGGIGGGFSSGGSSLGGFSGGGGGFGGGGASGKW